MVVRMLPAGVGSAWLCETVGKADAGAVTFGCPAGAGAGGARAAWPGPAGWG
jgi:hypothetical protein